MNRRSLLSALAATSLTPILPPQVFASGGIWNPDHCGFILESPPCQAWSTPPQRAGAIDPISVFAILMYGDGTNRQTGLIRT